MNLFSLFKSKPQPEPKAEPPVEPSKTIIKKVCVGGPMDGLRYDLPENCGVTFDVNGEDADNPGPHRYEDFTMCMRGGAFHLLVHESMSYDYALKQLALKYPVKIMDPQEP